MNPVIKGPLYQRKSPFIDQLVSGAISGVFYGGKNAKAQETAAKAQKEAAKLAAQSHEKTMETVKYVTITLFAVVIIYFIFKS